MNIAMTERKPAAAQSLKDKVSLITGSTSGIGLGIARALADAGSDVVLNGFGKPEEIEAVQGGVAKDFGVRVSYSGADMSNPESIAEMIATALRKFGRLDVLVNNAGIQHVAPLHEFPPAKWDAIIAINLSSAFHTTRLALPSMIFNKWGRIINIASAHGLVGSAYKSAYVAATRYARPHQGDGARDGRARHHLQRHLPRLCLHAARGGTDRRSGEGARHCARAGDPRGAAGTTAQQALRHRG
jgi:3-hydroxybutyrate dehydrogenase